MAISRDEVIRRSTIRKGVPYNQGAIAPDGWRADCSGFLSMVWNIPPSENRGWGGQSTVSLVTNGYITPISTNDLQPGDAIGMCGPSTGGDYGHIVLFKSWVDGAVGRRYNGAEHRGGNLGAEHRVISYPYDGMSGFRAYRFTKIAVGGDEEVTPADIKTITQNVVSALTDGAWRDGFNSLTFDKGYKEHTGTTLSELEQKIDGLERRITQSVTAAILNGTWSAGYTRETFEKPYVPATSPTIKDVMDRLTALEAKLAAK